LIYFLKSQITPVTNVTEEAHYTRLELLGKH
jgi:hypothetical protein